jgi:hypothetical protein
MPIVVACPTCHQKARVPDGMLGQTVTCPACAAAFTVPADVPPAPPEPPPVTVPAEPATRPLPADPDALRHVRAGTGVQLIALGLYAVALGLFLFVFVVTVAGSLSPGFGGPRGRVASALPILAAVVASVLMAVSGLVGIAGAAIAVLAPPAHLARGLAIAVLALTLLAFERLATALGWIAFYEQVAMTGQRFGVSGWTTVALVWLFEVGRLSALALFWRAICLILRDARGATTAWRLAIAGPAVQGLFVAAWLVLAFFGGMDSDMALLAVAGWLVLQLVVLLFSLGLAARVRRRLAAVVPARA